jgi:catechol 2,3-dioxygenase-like lactoylglutathione lyase family enzyme
MEGQIVIDHPPDPTDSGSVTAGPVGAGESSHLADRSRRTSWLAFRVARAAGDLGRSTVFYRDLLGLAFRGGFDNHDGYDGAFFALPGGGELELTSGPAQPRPGTEEDLLVLYIGTLDEAISAADGLAASGVPLVPSANPFWNRWGRTVLDPDGYRVVIAAREL